jgi:hypothetical protein
MFCSVHSVSIVPTGTLRLPWLRLFRAFSSVTRKMPGYNSQRRGTARTLPYYFDHSGFESQKDFQQKLIVLFHVLFVCKYVLYYCHRLSTQLQLTNISFRIRPSVLWGNSIWWPICATHTFYHCCHARVHSLPSHRQLHSTCCITPYTALYFLHCFPVGNIELQGVAIK